MRPALGVLACLALVACRAAGPPALVAMTDVDPRLRVLLAEEPRVADVLFGHADEVGAWLGPEVCVQRLELRHCRLDELLPILPEILFHPEPRRRAPVDVEPVRRPLLRLVGDPSRNRLLIAGDPEMVRWVAELLADWISRRSPFGDDRGKAIGTARVPGRMLRALARTHAAPATSVTSR